MRTLRCRKCGGVGTKVLDGTIVCKNCLLKLNPDQAIHWSWKVWLGLTLTMFGISFIGAGATVVQGGWASIEAYPWEGIPLLLAISGAGSLPFIIQTIVRFRKR